MPPNTDKTFRELFKERLDLYNNITPAAALFYDHNGDVGLRIEAPSIAKEFVDRLPFGRDPEGTLFYGSIGDIVGEATYSVFSNYGTQVAQGQEAVVVQFFDGNNNLYAEFVGQDPTRAVTHTAEGKKGEWVTLEQGWANANISKNTTSTTIHIKIPSIGKRVKLDFRTVPAATAANKKAIHHNGNIFFKTISDMDSGVESRVDFNNDRVLFYRNTKDGITADNVNSNLNDLDTIISDSVNSNLNDLDTIISDSVNSNLNDLDTIISDSLNSTLNDLNTILIHGVTAANDNPKSKDLNAGVSPNLKDLIAVFIRKPISSVETVAGNAHALGDLNFQTPLNAPAVWSTFD
ncbi:hypothetical protein K439DRAFT_1619025 [Ramaria rubella]|nr:hypothetical protein K439DRAFT_1619025 [Ramaria rubella]